MNDERNIDEAFLNEMMKRGEKAWKDVPDVNAWVEELRNGTLDTSDKPTPITDALMPDQGHKRTMYEHIQVMEAHARQLKCELADMTKDRDEWKANHDNQVSINRTLRDRPDLGERAKLVDALIQQRDEANIKRDEIFQALNKERQWMHEKMEAIRETMKTLNQLTK